MANRATRDQLAQRHLSLVRAIAASIYRRTARHIEFDELVSLGATGLVEAARRYDPNSETAFASFARHRIRGAMYDGLRKLGPLPRRVWRDLQALARADAYLEAKAITHADAAEPRTPASELRYLFESLSGAATALLVALAADAEPCEPAPGPDEQLARHELARELRLALSTLPERERRLIALHYVEGKSLLEAGAALGRSKSWASRTHARAIDRLRAQLVRRHAL
jgi:RNA polymerase sigma factor for flagellar operon FliA